MITNERELDGLNVQGLHQVVNTCFLPLGNGAVKKLKKSPDLLKFIKKKI